MFLYRWCRRRHYQDIKDKKRKEYQNKIRKEQIIIDSINDNKNEIDRLCNNMESFLDRYGHLCSPSPELYTRRLYERESRLY